MGLIQIIKAFDSAVFATLNTARIRAVSAERLRIKFYAPDKATRRFERLLSQHDQPCSKTCDKYQSL